MVSEKLITKISIIVPSYNQGDFLEECLLSIINQGYSNVEIIVMDGGSTDNSVSIIKKYEKYLAYWKSEKDNGQSAAINDGFKIATGEFVTWLNSDDVLLSGVLEEVSNYIHNNPKCNWFLGNLVWLDKEGNIIKVGKVETESIYWNKRHLFSNGGPTAFMRKSRLAELGYLREDFHYMMDTELWHRFLANGNYFVRINKYCWGLRLHENAKMSGHNFKQSALAESSHPSWIQKNKERDFIGETYRCGKFEKKLWTLLKVCRPTFYTRFYDKKYIGKAYSNIL